MSFVPGINSLVELIMEDDRVYRSRVESKDDATLTVAAPIGVGDIEPPRIGTTLRLGWIADKTRHVVPVRLTGLTRQQPPRWTVDLAGVVHEENRRRFMRGGAGGTAYVSRAGDGADPHPIVTTIIDVSEGGVRCRANAFDGEPGEAVWIKLTIDNESLETAAVLQSLRPPVEGNGVDVVVTFTLEERDAQRVRRYLYQLEIEERRRRRYSD